MNNLATNFKPTWTLQTPPLDNCSANCQAQIQGLPRWINNQPFWTYQCKCCQTYQFKPGQVGGFYV